MTGATSPELLIQDVLVMSNDPALDGARTKVHVRDDRIASVGTEVGVTASPSARRVDAAGAVLVPLMDASVMALAPEDGQPAVPAVGSAADFVVVSGSVSRHAALHQLVVPPSQLVLAVVDGRVVAEGGKPVVGHHEHAQATGAHDARWGVWRDAQRELDQRLTPDGRYDETRSGRAHAWTGACWLFRERVVYLDDTGFWAFGRFFDDRLHHAGFVMTKVD